MATSLAEPANRNEQTTQVAERHIDVVFSSTPCKMGSFIRFMTQNCYNHVAISLDDSWNELYSFARHYRDTPFFGGFVHESETRYRDRSRVAQIKVCRIPLTEEQYVAAKARLEDIRHNAEDYSYNIISAVVSPLHLTVRLPNSYTCVEFVSELLRLIGIPAFAKKRGGICSIRELETRLERYEVYRGHYPCSKHPKHDYYNRRQGVLAATAMTVVAGAAILRKFILRK